MNMHDQNFKNLILDYPREALAFFAQEETGEDLKLARIIPNLNKEGEIMGLAQILKQEGRQEGRQEECIAFVSRLLRRKFGIHPELDQSLVILQTLPIEKLEDMAEAIFDWTEVSDLTEWLKQQLLETNRAE